jgi:hypothetical protein
MRAEEADQILEKIADELRIELPVDANAPGEAFVYPLDGLVCSDHGPVPS